MEDYVNLDTIVDDSFYRGLKEYVICPLCSNILIDPVECVKCQKIYCKRCIDFWKKINVQCPNNCRFQIYQKSTRRNNMLSSLKIKCVGCNSPIKYFEAKEHHDKCCPYTTFSNISDNIEKPISLYFQGKITKERAEKLISMGVETKNISSTFIFYI